MCITDGYGRVMPRTVYLVPLVAAGFAVAACGSDDGAVDEAAPTTLAPVVVNGDADVAPPADTAPADEQMFPDVIDATAERVGDTWTISATVSSPYDTPQRYADAWRVIGPDGTVFGERVLTHDHANEQPFTRSESGISIPDDVTEVVIEGRDLEYGYGGDTFTLTLRR